MNEIVVVGHLCGTYGRKSNPEKVDAIAKIKPCNSITEVRRFLGACIFYQIWIPHFAHVSESLYKLLRKGNRFKWRKDQDEAMESLKNILRSPSILKQVDYKSNQPVVMMVDTSPIAIGWAVGQDDINGRRFATRFGARILTKRQRAYPQVKRELWGVVTALKAERNYLIGANVVLEVDCLPLLGMISNCSTPDIAMLRWIAFIKSFNPILVHIRGKKNAVADMLSRARYAKDEDMIAEEDDEDDNTNSYGIIIVNINNKNDKILSFKEELYDDKLRDVGQYLSTLQKLKEWTDKYFKEVRRHSYKYLLKDEVLWKKPKRKDGIPLRVVEDLSTKIQVLKEFHDSNWTGHQGIWATYTKIKERYWWKSLYKDVEDFVASCIECQLQSKIRYRDELHPTYPLSIHFQWVIDLVTMPNGIWGMKYLVLAREELSNFVEGKALGTKQTERVCRFYS